MIPTKTELLDRLGDSKVLVEFTKSDGTNRKMLCTQCEEFIPPRNTPTYGKKKIGSDTDVIRVYDLELDDWRSFHYDSLINADIPPETPEDKLSKLYDQLMDIYEDLAALQGRLSNVMDAAGDILDNL